MMEGREQHAPKKEGGLPGFGGFRVGVGELGSDGALR
jgi:hypothetical protein